MDNDAVSELIRALNAVNEPESLVDTATAASRLDLTRQTLANWRATGRHGLPYIRVGRRVRYRVADLTAFVNSNRVIPISK